MTNGSQEKTPESPVCSYGSDRYCCTSTAVQALLAVAPDPVLILSIFLLWQSVKLSEVCYQEFWLSSNLTDWWHWVCVCVFAVWNIAVFISELLRCKVVHSRESRTSTSQADNFNFCQWISVNFKHNCSSRTSIWLFSCYLYISLAHVHSWHFMWTFGCQLPPREQRFFASLRIPFVCEGRKGKTKQSNMLLPLCQQRESTRSTQMEGFHINGSAVGVSTQRRHCRDERCVLMRPAWEFNEAGRSEPKAMDAYWCEMFLGDSCLVAPFFRFSVFSLRLSHNVVIPLRLNYHFGRQLWPHLPL